MGSLLVLDMYADVSPLWNATNSFFGHSFVWSMRHNIAGRSYACPSTASRCVALMWILLCGVGSRRGLYGRFSVISSEPGEALLVNLTTGALQGLGVTADGIEVHDLLRSPMLWMFA